MRQWSTRELRYLEEHSGEGAAAVAKALGRSVDSVEWQARKCGISLRRRRQCPHCGRWTFRPLNRVNGWCIECTKELHMADLAEQAEAMKEEASREIRNNRTRQCFYSAKSRAKKKKNSHGKATVNLTCENTERRTEMQRKKKAGAQCVTTRCTAKGR